MVSNDGDLPLFLQVEDGNESDKKAFTKLIKKYQENLDLETIYVADSALYTAPNLAEMKKENLRWLTRVPLNVKKARERLTNVSDKEWKQGEEKGYKYVEVRENYHGIPQRWLILESEKRKDSDREKLARNIEKELTKIEKQIKKLFSKKKQENQEKEKQIKLLSKKWKYHELVKINYDKKQENYEVNFQENKSIIELEKRKCGRFIIATNVMDEQELSAEEMLRQYKNQQSCERGFRFLKDPLLLTKSVYVKSPKRVEVMARKELRAIRKLGRLISRKGIIINSTYQNDPIS